MTRIQANIYADCHEKLRGYQGAMLELPATPYEIRDALQRARVPEGGGYTLELPLDCPVSCQPPFRGKCPGGNEPAGGCRKPHG